MAYTTNAIVAAYLKRDLSDDEEKTTAILIPFVDSWIDNHFSSHFDETSETTKRFDGNGSGTILIQPCQSISRVDLVASDGTVLDSYDLDTIIQEPINETVKNELRRASGYIFQDGAQNISVTAIFSEYIDDVPSDIQLLATRIVSLLLQNAGEAVGVKRESLEGHTIEYQYYADDVAEIALVDSVCRMIIRSREGVIME